MKVIQNPTLPHAIIVDIDGTIADKWARDPYDWSKVSEDTPYTDIITLIMFFADTPHEIIFVSGRSEECRADTCDWIGRHTPLWNFELYMRKAWDRRKDSIIKYEILQDLIKEYYIAYVFDDRDQVVEMWRDAGLRCLQVAPGNF